MGTNGHRFERPQDRLRNSLPEEAREEAESEAQQSNFFSGEGAPRGFQNRSPRDAWSGDERPRTDREREGRQREEREREEREREAWSATDRNRRAPLDRDDREPRGAASRPPGQAPQRPQEGSRSRYWHREPLTAREVMTSDVRGVGPDASVEEMARLMRELDVGIVPVVDVDRRLLGVVTDRDLVVRALAEPDGTRRRAVDLASKGLQTIASDTPISDILDVMGKKQVRRLPVVDVGGVLLGMVSVGDIAQRADQDEELQHALQRISGRRSFWSRLWG